MWILPSLNRPEKLTHFLKSFKGTNNQSPGRVLVDEEDFKKNEKAYVEINNSVLPINWAFEVTKAVTMGGKCREFIPKLDPATKWVGIVNDDHVNFSEQCLDNLVKKLDGKNFVSANDRRPQAFSFPVTATAWSMDLLRAVQWPIFPPFLEHLFIDNLWHELSRHTGCWRMVASSIVCHNHPLFVNIPEDETHKKVYGKNFKQGEVSDMWKTDQANFHKFMQTEFPAVVQKIIKFQDQLPGQAWNPRVSGVKQ